MLNEFYILFMNNINNNIESQFKLANAWQIKGKVDAAIEGYQHVPQY